MASGFKDGTTDLDDLFMSYASGTKPNLTDFKVGTQDLRDRYQPWTTGTKRDLTGFKDGAVDLRDLFQASNVPLTTVTLSGQTVADFNVNVDVTCGIRVTTTGYVQQYQSTTASWVNVDATTDWIDPHTAADSTYYVRVTSVTGDAFTSSPGTNGNWFAISSNRAWELTASAGTGTKSTSFTLQISKPSGTVLDGGSYTLEPQSDPL